MHNFQVSNDETDPKIRMYAKNRVGQTLFENFDFLVKVKILFGQNFFLFFLLLFLFFFFFFFFLQAVRTGSDFQVGLSQMGVVKDDVISDVIALEG